MTFEYEEWLLYIVPLSQVTSNIMPLFQVLLNKVLKTNAFWVSAKWRHKDMISLYSKKNNTGDFYWLLSTTLLKKILNQAGSVPKWRTSNFID